MDASLTVVVVILIAQTIVLAKCGLYVEATVAGHGSDLDRAVALILLVTVLNEVTKLIDRLIVEGASKGFSVAASTAVNRACRSPIN